MRFDNQSADFPVFPTQIKFETSTGNNSFDRTFCPNGRQCGKQIYKTVVALHQHLCNACGTTKVSINLKWWVRIEQVRVGASFFLFIAYESQLVSYQLVGVVTIKQACPKANFPSHAPPGRRVATVNQRSTCCIK